MIFERERREVVEGGMPAVRVVEGLDVIESHEFSDGSGRRNGVAEAFGFESSDEAFRESVIVGIGGAAHACPRAARSPEAPLSSAHHREPSSSSRRGKLAAQGARS